MTAAKRTATAGRHVWEFKPRFRRQAFGWKSQPAIQRIGQAVTEIKKVARRDPILAAEGAVVFLERLSPAIEQVDSSSGAIGTTVNHAIDELVPIIAQAPGDPKVRGAWLERLWEAHAEDRMPYIEALADHWGELCGSKDVASEWADRLLDLTRLTLGPEKGLGGYFSGTPACLSALYRAERYAEILDLLKDETRWLHRRWAVKALCAMGKMADAIRLAESSRGAWTSDAAVDAVCEEMLLSAGLVEEAYTRYALSANRRGTYLATFRAVARKYPDRQPSRILADLVAATPGEEGKWFTAAKELGLYETAIELARTSPCDPKTLARAARDHAASEPEFAVEAAYIALDWMVQGYGYEIIGVDVWMAYESAIRAGESLGRTAEIKDRIRGLVEGRPGLVADVLGREFGLRH